MPRSYSRLTIAFALASRSSLEPDTASRMVSAQRRLLLRQERGRREGVAAGLGNGAPTPFRRPRGVKRVCIPNRATKSAERKREQKKHWFRDGQRWRTGSEGRISVTKRRHGLNRCRYRGDDGMHRWVGLGVIADNLINIGNAQTAPPAQQGLPRPRPAG